MKLSLRGMKEALRRPNMSRRGVIIIIILTSIFTIATLIRAFPAKYGFFLNEFDPYYDYYAALHVTSLIQQHGLFYALFNNPPNCGVSVFTSCHDQQGYFFWHDITTWWPYGRDVAGTSQDGLQIAGALLYALFTGIFGLHISLYDFLVLLPVFLGAFSSVLFYFLMKRIAGDTAGLFSALIVAVSPPLIERGNLGWFKSEPLAIFLFVFASYIFLSVFDNELKPRSRVLRAVISGLMMGYANTSWGGSLYFNVAFGLVFVLIPFLDLDLPFLPQALLAFTTSTIFASAIFPRPGVSIVTNPAGLALLGGTFFVLAAQWLRSWVKPSEYRVTLVKLLIGFSLAGLAVLSFGLVGGLSRRYLSAILPWSRSGNPLVESVAEHFIPTGTDYFSAYLSLLFFGIFGAIVAFRKRNLPTTYALIIGLTGLYVSAAFARLLVYSSIALALLAGIGFAEIVFALVKPSATSLIKKKPTYTTKSEMRVIYSIALVALISIPAGIYWIPNTATCTSANTFLCDQSPADSGVSLTNGGTVFAKTNFNDWTQTLQWIRDNTPKDAVIIAWWDYGYWITVMGNRTTVADNATLNNTRIAQIGRMFMSNTTTAAKLAKEMANGRSAYVLLFLVGSILTINGQQYYILQVPSGGGFNAGGGDESKKQWFIRIGGLDETQYLECSKVSSTCPANAFGQAPDDFNLTPFAIYETLFGQMIPFTFAGFLTSQGQVTLNYALDNQTGAPPLEVFNYPFTFNFPQNGNGPFRIAYHSPSLSNPTTCATFAGNTVNCFYTVLIYQVV